MWCIHPSFEDSFHYDTSCVSYISKVQKSADTRNIAWIITCRFADEQRGHSDKYQQLCRDSDSLNPGVAGQLIRGFQVKVSKHLVPFRLTWYLLSKSRLRSRRHFFIRLVTALNQHNDWSLCFSLKLLFAVVVLQTLVVDWVILVGTQQYTFLPFSNATFSSLQHMFGCSFHILLIDTSANFSLKGRVTVSQPYELKFLLSFTWNCGDGGFAEFLVTQTFEVDLSK